jgi:hypothetical protein
MSYTQQFDWSEEDSDATVYLTRSIRIRLTDTDKKPLPNAKCRCADAPETIYTADRDGIVCIPIPNTTSVDLEWEAEDAEQAVGGNRFCWRCTFNCTISSVDDPMCSTRLDHLGFEGETLADQVVAFQSFYNRPVTGDINDIRNELVEWHDGGDNNADSNFWE